MHYAVHPKDVRDGAGNTLWGTYVCETLRPRDLHPSVAKMEAATKRPSRGVTVDRSKVTCVACLHLTEMRIRKRR